jgi:hypothetical protein
VQILRSAQDDGVLARGTEPIYGNTAQKESSLIVMSKISEHDPDRGKGAVDDEQHRHDGNIGLEEQLGHRDQDPRVKDADTDFPEPGNNAEHSGERVAKKPSQKTKR